MDGVTLPMYMDVQVQAEPWMGDPADVHGCTSAGGAMDGVSLPPGVTLEDLENIT